MAASFPNLYDYNTETGMIVPITSDIQTYVENAMRDIFGSDIDLTPETPAGRMVEALTLMFKNAVGVNAQNMNQLNIQYASGQYLDSLAQFFGLERLPATQSVIGITVCSSEPSKLLPEGTILTDKNGYTYVVMDVIRDGVSTGGIRTGTVFHNNALPPYARYTGDGFARAIEYGPIRPYTVYGAFEYPNDTSLSFDNVDGITGVYSSQDSSGTTGRYAESDSELRVRISQARSFGSGCTQAIANAIWKVAPNLRTVRVIENPANSQQTISGVKMYPNSILVCLKGEFVDDPDDTILYSNREAIAKAIFATKPAGIKYTDSDHYPGDMYNDDTVITNDLNCQSDEFILYNPTDNYFGQTGTLFFSKFCVGVVDESSGIRYPVFFYSAEVIRIRILCTIRVNGYSGSNVIDDVRKVITQYVTSKIDTLTDTELMMIVSQAIPGVFITAFEMYEIPRNNYIEGTTTWGRKITSVTPNALQVIAPIMIDITIQNM